MNKNKHTTPDFDPDFDPRKDPLLEWKNASPHTAYVDVPYGNNSSTASELFEERLYYREGALDQLQKTESGMVDFWNNDIQYAKMDAKGFAIYPSEKNLKQFKSTQTEAYAMGFFVDVFEEFASYCDKYLYQAGDIFDKSPTGIFPINVVQGWQSIRNMYHSHIQILYKVFTEEFLKNKHSNILNFDHFLLEFVEFIKVIGPRFPITFSSFLLSKKTPSWVNGITVEISRGEYDDDSIKFTDFLLDTKFEFFRHAAKMHGLMIDKNIPWRLTADLSHPKILEKIKTTLLYGDNYTYKNFFDVSYYKAHREDIFLLRHHIAGFYNAYVQFKPTIDRPTIPMRKGKRLVGTRNKWYTRKALKAFKKGKLDPNSLYFEQYNNLYWLRFYFHIKSLEMGLMMTKNQISAEIPKYYNIYRTFNFERAQDVIYTDLMDRFLRKQSKRGFFGSLTRHDKSSLLSSFRDSTATEGTTAPSAGAATSPNGGGSGGMGGGY